MLSRVLKTCLDIKKNEAVLIVTDYEKIDVASIIEEACRKLSNEVMTIKMKPRSRNAEEPPKAVAQAMRSVDVVLAPTSKSLTHTDARKKACEAGARVATMPGITMDMLTKGAMLADYTEVRVLSEKFAKLLTEAKEIKIENLGYTFYASVEGRKGIADSGIITKKGAFGNLPAGEAFIAPVEGKSYGKLAIDGSFASIGLLSKPIILTIEEGRVIKKEGDEGKLQIEKYKNGDVVAEIGIGTNPKARVTGIVLEDEKVHGTVHIALGDNHTFGGETKAEIHIDGVMLKPSLWIDNKKVIEKGRFVV